MTLICFHLQIHLVELLSPDELEATGVAWDPLAALPLLSRMCWTPQVVLRLWCPCLPLVSFPSALSRHLVSSASAQSFPQRADHPAASEPLDPLCSLWGGPFSRLSHQLMLTIFRSPFRCCFSDRLPLTCHQMSQRLSQSSDLTLFSLLLCVSPKGM